MSHFGPAGWLGTSGRDHSRLEALARGSRHGKLSIASSPCTFPPLPHSVQLNVKLKSNASTQVPLTQLIQTSCYTFLRLNDGRAASQLQRLSCASSLSERFCFGALGASYQELDSCCKGRHVAPAAYCGQELSPSDDLPLLFHVLMW